MSTQLLIDHLEGPGFTYIATITEIYTHIHTDFEIDIRAS